MLWILLINSISGIWSRIFHSTANNMIKVSVIIPVYNGEAFLKPCLDSVLQQTLKDIQIICIDDGSTDHSLEILKEYAQSDHRICILTQKNQFAGAARNRGLLLAEGEYVVFWDADDYFELNALEIMYQRCKTENADICLTDAIGFDSESGKILKQNGYIIPKRFPKKQPFNIDDIPEHIFNIAGNFPWLKMFQKDFLTEQNLYFQDIRIANDTFFSLVTIALAKRIVSVNQALVHYRLNNTQSLSAKPSGNYRYLTEAYQKAKLFLEERHILDHPFVHKSFVNKALSSVMYLFHKETTYVGFAEMFNYYTKEGGFEQLGITDKGAEYFISQQRYEDFFHMIHLPIEEYLFYKFSAAQKKNKDNQLLIAELKKEKQNLKSQNKTIKKCNSKLTAQCKQLQAQSVFSFLIYKLKCLFHKK